jgi:hypothetical protein
VKIGGLQRVSQIVITFPRDIEHQNAIKEGSTMSVIRFQMFLDV